MKSILSYKVRHAPSRVIHSSAPGKRLTEQNKWIQPISILLQIIVKRETLNNIYS